MKSAVDEYTEPWKKMGRKYQTKGIPMYLMRRMAMTIGRKMGNTG